MNDKNYITPSEAIVIHKRAGFGPVGKFTIVDWCKKHGIGLKIGGRWRVDKEKFERFLREGTYRDGEA